MEKEKEILERLEKIEKDVEGIKNISIQNIFDSVEIKVIEKKEDK